LWHSW